MNDLSGSYFIQPAFMKMAQKKFMTYHFTYGDGCVIEKAGF